MNDASGSEGITARYCREFGRFRARNLSAGRSRASCEATSAVQDAPRAATRASDLLAMTRLASPNRLNNCASFFAKPL